MRLSTRTYRLTALATAWVMGAAPLAAQSFDAAAVMPQDTKVYVGWSELIDSEQVRLAQKQFEAVLKMVGEDASPDAEMARRLLTMFATAASGQGGIGVAFDQPGPAGPNPRAFLVVDAGAASNRIATMLREFAEADEAEVERVTVDGESYQAVRPGFGPGFLWGTRDGKFVLVVAEDEEAAVMQLAAPGNGLSRSINFAKARAGVDSDAGDAAFTFYVAVPEIIDALVPPGDNPPRAALVESGVSAIQSFYMELRHASSEKLFARIFMPVNGKLRGALKLWAHEPLQRSDLQMIPQNASWAIALQLDFEMLYEEVLRVLDEVAPDAAGQLEAMLGMVESQTRFSLEDVAAAYADTQISFATPDTGGFLFFDSVSMAEMKDRSRAVEYWEQGLMQPLMPILPQVAGRIMTTEHQGHEIRCMVYEGYPSPVAPSMTTIDRWQISAMFPQFIYAVLPQLGSGESILSHPDVEAALQQLPADKLQSFYYSDNRNALRSWYGLALMVKTALASLAPTPEFNPGVLPTLPEKLANAKSAVGGWWVDDDGVHFGATGSLMPIGGGVGIAVGALLVSIALPSLTRARELAKRAVSQANLRAVGVACYIWANDNDGRFPPDLALLVREGYIGDQQLTSPRQDGPPPHYVYIAGQGEDADLRNVLAYEKLYGDEGTNVLFVDGHVEWMQVWDFEDALRETYERLGREYERPQRSSSQPSGFPWFD